MERCNPCEVHVTTKNRIVIEYLYEWPHGGRAACMEAALTDARNKKLECVWASLCRILGERRRTA